MVTKSSVKVINKTVELNEYEDGKQIREDMTIIAGKAAGICYMPDDYLDKGIQDIEKAKKRANNTAKSGHFSVFEHGHISFLINTSKMMAMILNSTGLYSTSEKSARYTVMKPNTELEGLMYTKWKNRFIGLISAYYKSMYNDKDIEKLAMENARYMTSVFTPTLMEFTVPYNRAVMLPQWLNQLAVSIDLLMEQNIEDNHKSPYSDYAYFYNQIAMESRYLAEELSKAIGVSMEDPLLVDLKHIDIDFIRAAGYVSKLRSICEDNCFNAYDNSKRTEFYSDVYISNYKASFAEIAQAERHRTLHYTIDLPMELDCYVPKMLRGSAFEIEWRDDFKSLLKNRVVPQCTLVDITENGRFEDFFLKCKERLCSRAQLEIMEITRDQVVKFAMESNNLCIMNKKMLDSMIRQTPNVNYKKPETIIVESRCRFTDFVCKEPCKIANDTINYYRNI